MASALVQISQDILLAASPTADPRTRFIAAMRDVRDRCRQAQLRFYGEDRWNANFVLLRNIEAVRGIRLEGDELRKKVWAELPNCKFKRFQELFCAADELIVPKFEFAGSTSGLFDRQALAKLSVEGTLVDPCRISENLLASLGLTTFSGLQRDPIARLEVRGYKSTIQGLKRIWDSSQPIESGNYRIMRVSAPTDEIDARFVGAAPIASSAVGTLLYSWENAAEMSDSESGRHRLPRRLSIAHYDSPYTARRKTYYEAAAYQREITALSSIIVRTKELQERINAEWKKGLSEARREELRASAQAELGASVQVLKRCVNEHKVRAHDILNDLKKLNLKDRLGRDNPGAVLAKLVSALHRIQRRYLTMYPIGAFNTQDEMILSRRVIDLEARVRRLDEVLAVVANAKLFQDSEAKLAPGESKGLLNRILPVMNLLRDVQIRPFSTFGRRLVEKYKVLEECLSGGNLVPAKQAIIEMHVICKLHAVNAAFEAMRLQIAQHPNISPEELTAFTLGIRSQFTTRQIFPECTIDGLTGPCEVISDGLDALERGLMNYTQDPENKSKRIGFTKRFKEFLNAYNIESLVAEIP